MNYTGYGTDPNYIYSFRPSGKKEGFDFMGVDQVMNPLRSSLAYRQAGMEGKRRMEKVVLMGLPFNTDINKIKQAGFDPRSGSFIYAAPRPQPWGTWGPLGSTQSAGGYNEEELERMEEEENKRAASNKKARGGRKPSDLSSNEEKKAYARLEAEEREKQRRAIRPEGIADSAKTFYGEPRVPFAGY